MDEQPAPAVMIEGKCGNCQFWKKIELRGPREIGAEQRGQCWLLPPTPVAMYTRDMSAVAGQLNIRAATKEGDGCGMFAARADLLQSQEIAPAG